MGELGPVQIPYVPIESIHSCPGRSIQKENHFTRIIFVHHKIRSAEGAPAGVNHLGPAVWMCHDMVHLLVGTLSQGDVAHEDRRIIQQEDGQKARR